MLFDMESEVTASESIVLYDVDDAGVALITWNRPERSNAWTAELGEAYVRRLEQARDDPAVRAIVVTGAGRHFSPGMDAAMLTASSASARAPREPRSLTFATTVLKPIIVAIHGACAGTAFIQACMADVRFADADARNTAAFVRRGIIVEHGLAVRLPALVGLAHANDILLSGRVLSGEETAAMGLTRRSEPGRSVEDALAYARDLALNCSPQAVALSKAQLQRPIADELERARVEFARLWAAVRSHPDFAEGVASLTERRAPRFAGVGADELVALRTLLDDGSAPA
jgi:enoyl-CoA hydratase/carnithine racemase